MLKLIVYIIIAIFMELKYYNNHSWLYLLLDVIIIIGFHIYGINIIRSKENKAPFLFKKDIQTLIFYIIIIILFIVRLMLLLFRLKH